MTNIPHPVDLTVKPKVKGFFDEATNTVSYVVQDPSSNACAIIDSVMDIDYAAAASATSQPTKSSHTCRRTASRWSG